MGGLKCCRRRRRRRRMGEVGKPESRQVVQVVPDRAASSLANVSRGCVDAVAVTVAGTAYTYRMDECKRYAGP